MKPDRSLKLGSSVTTGGFVVGMGKGDQCVSIPNRNRLWDLSGFSGHGAWVKGRNTKPQWRPTKEPRDELDLIGKDGVPASQLAKRVNVDKSRLRESTMR